jgi:hypothetical protein
MNDPLRLTQLRANMEFAKLELGIVDCGSTREPCQGFHGFHRKGKFSLLWAVARSCRARAIAQARRTMTLRVGFPSGATAVTTSAGPVRVHLGSESHGFARQAH